ncbi:MAG: hypothetical protein LBF74_13745 [Treponema sp.]|jgi:hypothetical protein|nr:hypothetical protein [Treponema sp.]
MAETRTSAGRKAGERKASGQDSGGSRRRGVIRAALIALWIGAGVILFIFSRGHALLVDNRNLQDQGIRAPDMITVFVDDLNGLEFFRGDRDRFQVAGSKHRISVEFSDGTPPFEGTFTLPIKDDMYILSIPKMISGIEPFVEVFRSAEVNREEAAAARAAGGADQAGEAEGLDIFDTMFGE